MVCGFRLDLGQMDSMIYHSFLRLPLTFFVVQAVSGSWVVNQENGDLYGIGVAADRLDKNLIMLRARDVFDDIERVRGCLISRPQLDKT